MFFYQIVGIYGSRSTHSKLAMHQNIPTFVSIILYKNQLQFNNILEILPH